MSNDKNYYYEFGPYRMDTFNKVLLRNETPVHLSPKVFETLFILVKQAGQTVSKEEIFKEIWAHTFVEESNLTQNIFHLRKILSDGNKKINYIETFPKRGYRFTPPVLKIPLGEKQIPAVLPNQPGARANKELEIESFSTVNKKGFINSYKKFAGIACLLAICLISGIFLFFSSRVESPKPSKHSIAVLPFKHIGENKSDEHLQTGVADAITNKLSRLRQMEVRPTSTILQLKKDEPLQLGKELAVKTILTGVIQQNNDRIRITVQLINVDDGATIWAEKYDVPLQEIFALQDDISEKILQSLKVQINAEDNVKIVKRHTDNIEAFEAYSRGRYFWATSSVTDLNKSIKYFQKAIELDPNYALAFLGLADAQLFYATAITGKPVASEYIKLAKLNATKALELDNTLAEPHTTLAAIIYEENGDWASAEKEFLKSIELNPNYAIAHNWYSLHLLGQGDFQKAESEMKKALQIDPISPSMVAALGQIYYYGKQYDLAVIQFEKALELDPDFARAKVYLSLALMEIGKKEQALSILEKVYQGYPQHTVAKTTLGWLYVNLGQRDKAEEILRNFEKIEVPDVFDKYAIALINAELGNTDKVFSILEEISKFRNLSIILRLKFDPKLDSLRKEERFQKILQQF